VKPLSFTAGKILLSIYMEVMMSFPAGKMLDMEATIATAACFVTVQVV